MQTGLLSRCESSTHGAYSIRENELYASHYEPCDAGQGGVGGGVRVEDKPGFRVGRAPLSKERECRREYGLSARECWVCTYMYTYTVMSSPRCVVKHSLLGRYREPPGAGGRPQLSSAPHQPLYVTVKPGSSSRTQFCPFTDVHGAKHPRTVSCVVSVLRVKKKRRERENGTVVKVVKADFVQG